jgi:hypothetical protein
MLARVVAASLCVFAPTVTHAWSYAFSTHASGRLGAPITFEFRGDSTGRAKTDISEFTVCIRTADHRWRPVWSIVGHSRLRQAIDYGVTPSGFATRIPPQTLRARQVYAAFASDGRGGSSGLYFRFDLAGEMKFPSSPD